MDIKKQTRWNWFATGNKRLKKPQQTNYFPGKNPMDLVNKDIRHWFSAIDD